MFENQRSRNTQELIQSLALSAAKSLPIFERSRGHFGWKGSFFSNNRVMGHFPLSLSKQEAEATKLFWTQRHELHPNKLRDREVNVCGKWLLSSPTTCGKSTCLGNVPHSPKGSCTSSQPSDALPKGLQNVLHPSELTKETVWALNSTPGNLGFPSRIPQCLTEEKVCYSPPLWEWALVSSNKSSPIALCWEKWINEPAEQNFPWVLPSWVLPGKHRPLSWR